MSAQPMPVPRPEPLLLALERDGIVEVPGLVAPEALAAMQGAFDGALQHPSWNTWRGYEQTDRHRLMVEQILTLDPAFQKLSLHPLVLEVMAAYIGSTYVLSEVRGWQTIATRRGFHGWHNDAWYDHTLPSVPRELKLALYLTDVETGHFSYVKGTHIDSRHRHWNDREVSHLRDRMVDMKAPAGSTFLFDTSGIHRQSSPVLKPRRAVMFNYHDAAIPLQELDVRQYRYDPLVLNAAFLGGLSDEEQRVLGFGDQATYQRGYRSPQRYASLHALFRRLFAARLRVQESTDFCRDIVGGVARRLRRR
jgi:peptidoglycan hydrolase-like protein with peptidoglycan-binding domain